MIISHSNQFIHFKSGKTASTSLDIFFSAYCDESDVITSVDLEGKKAGWFKAKNSGGFSKHMFPIDIKNKISSDLFNTYYKFTSVRNPWDKMVSIYYWVNRNKDNIVKDGFKNWIVSLTKINWDDFRLEPFCKVDGEYILDDYIRFENLEEDIKNVCNELNLKYDPKYLIKTKSNTNPRLGYKVHYDAETIDLVSDKLKYEIETFGYSFE
jgi:hypothetical protein